MSAKQAHTNPRVKFKLMRYLWWRVMARMGALDHTSPEKDHERHAASSELSWFADEVAYISGRLVGSVQYSPAISSP